MGPSSLCSKEISSLLNQDLIPIFVGSRRHNGEEIIPTDPVGEVHELLSSFRTCLIVIECTNKRTSVLAELKDLLTARKAA
jgi:hypothetical protein